MRTPDRCPKCGAPIVKRWTGKSSKLPRWAYQCGSEWTGKYTAYSMRCLLSQLAAMTARAEKAEALAQYRLEAIRVRDRAAQPIDSRVDSQPCLYCGSSGDECYQSCPTVTHPVEVQE